MPEEHPKITMLNAMPKASVFPRLGDAVLHFGVNNDGDGPSTPLAAIITKVVDPDNHMVLATRFPPNSLPAIGDPIRLFAPLNAYQRKQLVDAEVFMWLEYREAHHEIAPHAPEKAKKRKGS